MPSEENAVRWVFAWRADYRILIGRLHEGHWVHAFSRDLNQAPVQVRLLGRVMAATFRGRWLSNHRRIETRRCFAIDQLDCLHEPNQWPDSGLLYRDRARTHNSRARRASIDVSSSV